MTNDSDPDHDPLGVTGISSQPKNGTAIINTNNNTITYTPVANFFGTDTFAYRISDGHPDGTATAVVTVTVNHINHPPVANAGPDQTVNENKTVTLNGTKSSDPDGTIQSYIWTQTAGPKVNLTSANTPTPSFIAPHILADTTLTFNIKVRDNEGANRY